MTPIPAAIPNAASSKRLVFRWSVHMVDDQDFDWAFVRFEFESELILNCSEKSGARRVRSR